MYGPNLKSIALPVPEIIGVLKNFGQSLDTPFKSRSFKVIDLILVPINSADRLPRFSPS